MAIQYDASAACTSTSVNPSWSHTVAATGTNHILLVFTAETFPTANVTAVTYGGVSMLKGKSSTTGSGDIILWHLEGPLTGANTVQITGGNGQAFNAHSMSFSGVDQDSPFGESYSSSGAVNNSGPASVGFASLTGTEYYYGVGAGFLGRFGATAADLTASSDIATVTSTSAFYDGGNNSGGMEIGYGAFVGASFDCTWTGTSGYDQWGSIALSLAPAGTSRVRAVKYFHDINDPAGRIFNDKGKIVQPWELKPNNWIRVTGLFLPTSTKYASFTKDPELAYIEEVTFSARGGLRIKTNRGEMTEVLLARAAGGRTL